MNTFELERRMKQAGCFTGNPDAMFSKCDYAKAMHYAQESVESGSVSVNEWQEALEWWSDKAGYSVWHDISTAVKIGLGRVRANA